MIYFGSIINVGVRLAEPGPINIQKVEHPSEKEVLDILPNRFEQDLIQYFKTFPNRSDVQFFVTDMNPHFKAVAKTCFPKATIIADRYHVIRQVVWAMENVRKSSKRNSPINSEGTLNDPNPCSASP